MNWVWLILRCFAVLLSGPLLGFGTAAAMTFGGHWLSGEAAEPSSGQPWIMVGAMLFVPVGILVGAAGGLVVAMNTFTAGVEAFGKKDSPK